jgi:hypothetical protein
MLFRSVLGAADAMSVSARLVLLLVSSLALASAASAQPANNNFGNATFIQSGQTLTGTNVAATKEPDEPNHADNVGGQSVWWRFAAPVSGPVTVRTCGSNFDTLLAVYTGTSVGALDSMAQNDDNLAACGTDLQSQVTFSANAGTTYFIAVDGFNGVQGNVTLNVNQVPLACDARARLGDFNGDVRRDLLFRRTTDGTLAIFLMDGFSFLGTQIIGAVGTEWGLIGTGDFNADGKSDLLFRRASDGALFIFLMDGFNILASQLVGQIGNEWRFLGTGDFNGDRRSDLMFFNLSTRQVSMYLMEGFIVAEAQIVFTVFPGFEVVGIGDFNGDGRSDIMTRHQTDGRVFLGLINGFNVPGEVFLGVIGGEWTPAAIGDITGGGISDIIMRRDDGMLALFTLRNDAQSPLVRADLLGPIGTEWTLVGLGDFDGDGKADLLFRSTTDGSLVIYLMDGISFRATQIIGAVGTEWSSCYANPG